MAEAIVLRAAQAEQKEADWGKLTWHASRALGNSEDMTIGVCRLKPGQSNPKHHHPNCSEVLVVMQGRIRHTVSDTGEEVDMSAGDAITAPAGFAAAW